MGEKKRWLKRGLWVFGVLSVFAFSTLTRMDFTPLESTEYYKESKRIISDLEIPKRDTVTLVKAGWSKKNITPHFPFKVIGFGKNKISDGVLDSVYVRAVVFEQGAKCIAYISYDLMIVHPLIVKSLESELLKSFPVIDEVYYSATHTHNSIGGYGDKAAGYFALGGHDPRIIGLLVEQTISAIKESYHSKETVEYSYGQYDCPELVRNRLDKENGEVDGMLRGVFLRKVLTKETALISTFSAHATSLGRKYNMLSRDYPGALCDSIEEAGVADFALFSAGAVGSHESSSNEFNPKRMGVYSRDLIWAVMNLSRDRGRFKPLKSISCFGYSVPLREPHLKVGLGFRLRPWVFEAVFGKGKAMLTYFTLGDVVFVGTPCDFSGELTLEINKKLNPDNINKVIITSFNGEYIGYVTPDKYYLLDKHEVRDVNWFGPYNGRYFHETISETLIRLDSSY